MFRKRRVFALNPKKTETTDKLLHKIETNGSNPQLRRPYRIAHAHLKEVNNQVEEMLKNGIIRDSVSPWNAPVLLVKKKDGSVRFVCDFRALNDVTDKDTYPLPLISDVIDKMEGNSYWTSLDAASAYWSVPIAEVDKEKTSFTVLRGKYEFNVTPFGLCNAGATY